MKRFLASILIALIYQMVNK